MEELGITSIPANSPQAKGRIERLWGTFQDRLVSELRLAGASTIEEANQVLWNFLPRYEQRFAVPAREPGLAYRKTNDSFRPEEVFCFKHERVVGPDNVVRFGGHRLQVLPNQWPDELCQGQDRGAGATGWQSSGLLPWVPPGYHTGTGRGTAVEVKASN